MSDANEPLLKKEEPSVGQLFSKYFIHPIKNFGKKNKHSDTTGNKYDIENIDDDCSDLMEETDDYEMPVNINMNPNLPIEQDNRRIKKYAFLKGVVIGALGAFLICFIILCIFAIVVNKINL